MPASIRSLICFFSLICSIFCFLTIAQAAPSVEPQSPISGQQYKIGPGDVLQITVWKEDGMDLKVLVTPSGGISFPLVGELHASGLTTQQLTNALVAKLKKYIPDPFVTVSVLQSLSNKVYVIGKVARPGAYTATGYMDVLQALSMAGGLTPYADSDDIKIIRQQHGVKKVFNFDYDDVISGKNLDMNIRLEAGDTVAVP